jgi:uncharacterized glyoxalase superfamily protein PhnB
MGMNIFVPALTVSNIKQSVRFYEDALGFSANFSIPGPDGDPVFVNLVNGTANLMLNTARPDDPIPTESGSLGRGVNLYVGVEGSDDIDALFDRAKQAGARVMQAPTDEFWGDRDWTVADPDGYLITVGKQMRTLSPEEMLEASKSLVPA